MASLSEKVSMDGYLREDLAEKVSFVTSGAIHVESTSKFDLTEETMSPKQPYPEFEAGPFEGVEKRLIVEFCSDVLNESPLLKNGSLRSLSKAEWQTMLDRANCQILSSTELVTESGSCTAYLLSESSLFVYDHRVVLKTCGTTTPLLTLPTLISFVIGSTSASTAAPDAEEFSLLSLRDGFANQQLKWKADTPDYFQLDTLSLTSRTTEAETRSISRVVSSPVPLATESSTHSPRTNEGSDASFSPRNELSYCSPPHFEDRDSPRAHPTVEDEAVLLPERRFLTDFEISNRSAVVSTSSMLCLSPNSRSGTPLRPERPTKSEITAALQHYAESDVTWIASRIPRVVSWMLFSHLTYCFPEKQRYPHRSNEEEIEYLDQFCRQKDMPKQSVDIFSLRTSENREFFVYAYRNRLFQNELLATKSTSLPVVISELLMLDISPDCVDNFAGKGNGYNANEIPENAIVHQVVNSKTILNSTTYSDNSDLWGNTLDQFWFDPCGYSCNALMEEPIAIAPFSSETDLRAAQCKPFAPHYANAHISPEPQSSYASLEVTFPFNQDPVVKDTSKQIKLRSPFVFQLSSADILTTFNPFHVHVVEVELCGSRDSSRFLGGTLSLKSSSSVYNLVKMEEYRGEWFHIRHAEYIKSPN